MKNPRSFLLFNPWLVNHIPWKCSPHPWLEVGGFSRVALEKSLDILIVQPLTWLWSPLKSLPCPCLEIQGFSRSVLEKYLDISTVQPLTCQWYSLKHCPHPWIEIQDFSRIFKESSKNLNVSYLSFNHYFKANWKQKL